MTMKREMWFNNLVVHMSGKHVGQMVAALHEHSPNMARDHQTHQVLRKIVGGRTVADMMHGSWVEWPDTSSLSEEAIQERITDLLRIYKRCRKKRSTGGDACAASANNDEGAPTEGVGSATAASAEDDGAGDVSATLPGGGGEISLDTREPGAISAKLGTPGEGAASLGGVCAKRPQGVRGKGTADSVGAHGRQPRVKRGKGAAKPGKGTTPSDHIHVTHAKAKPHKSEAPFDGSHAKSTIGKVGEHASAGDRPPAKQPKATIITCTSPSAKSRAKQPQTKRGKGVVSSDEPPKKRQKAAPVQKVSKARIRKTPAKISPEAEEWILVKHIEEVPDSDKLATKSWFKALRTQGIEAKFITEDHTVESVVSCVRRHVNKMAMRPTHPRRCR